VPPAEESGLIVPIVLRQACLDAPDLPGSIKKPSTYRRCSCAAASRSRPVFSALAASGLPAQRLELEISVPVRLENSEATPATLPTPRDHDGRGRGDLRPVEARARRA